VDHTTLTKGTPLDLKYPVGLAKMIATVALSKLIGLCPLVILCSTAHGLLVSWLGSGLQTGELADGKSDPVLTSAVSLDWGSAKEEDGRSGGGQQSRTLHLRVRAVRVHRLQYDEAE
jgi:hypothetical protein